MGNKDKTRDETATSNMDESRDTALARTIALAVAEAFAKQKAEETKLITETFTRQMEKTEAQYQELLKASRAQNFSSTLKVSSGSQGFRVMDPFDWTLDKNIYQRWQLWSIKARKALEAMEGDTEKTKISYLHHWLHGKGIDKINGWVNSKILISPEEYEELEERDRIGKYPSDQVESYFSLVENILTPRSNPLLAVEELHVAKQGSMTSQDCHSHILQLVKRCQFPNPEAEERAIRDAIFIGMNSQRARDKAINLMNEEGKAVTVEFLMNHLAVEDGNSQHKFLSQLNSNSSVNMIAYDRRQNRGKSNKGKQSGGKSGAQNKSRGQSASFSNQPSRKPPGMEGKCMRCGKPEHSQGQKCAAKNAKCKGCHKIGHFYKVCQSKKTTRRANLAQAVPQDENDTHIDECGLERPNPPLVSMLKIINHVGTTSGSQEKHLQFPIDVDVRGSYKDQIVVRVDTGADINCMNETTFRKLFQKVKLDVCPHEIQNFGNSTADISILGQFQMYLLFCGKKYLNTFIVTNANDCPNLLSHGATFRMGVLKPNYPKENVVKGEEVPNFKIGKTTSNVFQILQDLHLRQQFEPKQYRPSTTFTTQRKVLKNTSNITTDTVNIDKKPTLEHTSKNLIPCKTIRPPKTSSFRTMLTPTTNTAQPASTRRPSELPPCCRHVLQAKSQTHTSGETPALRKVQHPHNGRTSVSRFPLTKQEILSQYSGCFEGIGRFPGDPYKFHLKPDYKPAQHAPRKVPVHLEKAFKEEIDSLVSQGILEEVREHTDWVNSYVIVEKDTGNTHAPNHTIKKKLRICLDPRDLNEALEREPYHTRSVDEITAKLQGMTVFTIVDFRKGYWMVVLHPDSRKLTCMALPFGRFQWTRLPMGTVVAQDIFQSKLDAIFIGMNGVTGIADDMIIAGKDEMEHDRNFQAFMEKCMENNLTLNAEKIQFKQKQVSFYGHVWSKAGISPDPKKIQALKHMEFPPDKETMRSFLGMINYLNRYSALSAHLAAPLSSLTHQVADYKPEKIHMENFRRLKMEISNTEALPYFNTSAETTLQTDASKKGLGACLIQNDKVVCYASRSLTKTEQNYQNLEREALGTIWGMEKFHYFLYGKEFTLETDQKPLVSIYKKHMIDISPRVQRLIVRSFPYQPFTVVYKKGKDIPVADALSRVSPMDPEDNIKLPIIAVNMITKLVLTSTFAKDNFSRKLDRIRERTQQDEQLTRLSRYIYTGFPCEKKNLPRDLQDYWNHRDMLSIENGLVTCGSRIIVPHEMRAEILQYIHEGHQGKERCLLRARNTVFWPRISYDIQELIEKCIICQEHGRSQPIIGITQELPPFPWHTLATDIFYWKCMDFLIVADVFSRYFLVRKLVNSTSTAVCAEIATIVTELGLPHIIRSDNGPCYNSKEFQQMLQRYNITHQTSSPHHPRSNGFVERMVGVAKKLMDKAGSEGKPWISGLYEYRVTPQSGSIASPLQLLTQRTPREKDLPQLPSTLGAQEMHDTCQEIIRRQPSRPERHYPELTPGMAVWVQHRQSASWEPAIVASQINPNSYWIMQENGDGQPKLYKRTRSMLKIRCTEVRRSSFEYNQSTENHKAKFPSPFTYTDERNSVRHDSVNEVSNDLVNQTKSSVSDSVFSEEKEENADIAEGVEGTPAEEPAPIPAPAPAPATAPSLELPRTPEARRSTRKNLGRPASAYSDFYM